MKTYLKAFRLKRFWLLLLLPAAFLLDFAARQSADFAEWYAVTIYPVYAQFFSAITGVFPFSALTARFMRTVYRKNVLRGSSAESTVQNFNMTRCAASRKANKSSGNTAPRNSNYENLS